MREVVDEDNNNDINTDLNNINNMDSKKKIIMKCNEEFLTFEKGNYPTILEDYISKNEWEIIAEEANSVIGNAYHLRKKEEVIKIPKYMNSIFWTVFFFCLIDYIFLILYTKNEKVNEIVIYSALSLILVSSGIIIGLMFYNYSREFQKEKTMDSFIIEGMNKYLDELNKRYENLAIFNYNHDKLEIECILNHRII